MSQKTTCTRNIQFDAGHRVFKHQGKCKNLHGHRYSVDITVSAESLNELGMIADFSCLKELCGGWIDKNWDHKFLYYERDSEISTVLNGFHGRSEFKDFSSSFVKLEFNPTAENMSVFLLEKFQKLLSPQNIKVMSVLVRETPNCWSLTESVVYASLVKNGK